MAGREQNDAVQARKLKTCFHNRRDPLKKRQHSRTTCNDVGKDLLLDG